MVNRTIRLFQFVIVLIMLQVGRSFAQVHSSTTLWHRPFGRSITPWVPSGTAQFSYERYLGFPCLKIVVGDTTNLSFAHFSLRRIPVTPADILQGEVWVHSSGVSTGIGPYIALVLHNAGGVRTAVTSSVISLQTGKKGWRKLVVTARAPQGTVSADFNLLLQAHGTVWFRDAVVKRLFRAVPWPSLGSKIRTVRIFPHRVITHHILGPGFVVYHQNFHEPRRVLNRVIFRRWMELRPSFARMAMAYPWKPGGTELTRMARYLRLMMVTHTAVYVTTWNPPVVKSQQEINQLADHVVQQLKFLVDTKKCTNIKYYCFTNELTMGAWGSLMDNLPLFGAIQQAVYNRLRAADLPIGLLSTDASPISYWTSITWAAEHVDGITAVYGGHNYPSGDYLTDDYYYPWLLQRFRQYAHIAKQKHKQFILGEFGSRGNGSVVNGVHLDSCIYFGTPLEPLVGTQLAEITIAALNAGFSGMGYWTFMDLPQGPLDTYQNHWGLTKDAYPYSTRSPYYAYGLITRYLHGPADVVQYECNDPRLRVAALHRPRTNSYSIALLNRNTSLIRVHLQVPGVHGHYNLYLYNPAEVHQNRFGSLPSPIETLNPHGDIFSFTVPPSSLIVCTRQSTSAAPRAVSHLSASRLAAGGWLISWHNTDKGPHFERIYRTDRGYKRVEIAETAGDSVHLLNSRDGEQIWVAVVGNNGKISPAKSVLCK